MAAKESRPKRNRTLTYIPTDVLPFHSGPRQGPSQFHIGVQDVIMTNPDTRAYARSIDFGWMLCRQPIDNSIFTLANDRSQVIPAWTAFNIKLKQKDVPRESSIGYCQVIDASPTEMPTVYNLLQRSLQIADQLGQQNVIIVLDQAITLKLLKSSGKTKKHFSASLLGWALFTQFALSWRRSASDLEMQVLETS